MIVSDDFFLLCNVLTRAYHRYMGHPLLCDRLYGGGVKFSKDELIAMATSETPLDLPLSVRVAGAVDGALQDLLEASDLASVSPPLAAARGNGGMFGSVMQCTTVVCDMG